MNDFSLRSLRYFLAAADSGSIAAASTHLHISPASISTAISALEDRLNMQLFVRLPARGMQLTPAGERFAIEARSLIASAEELELFAHILGSEVHGEISVACFTNLAPMYLSNLLAQFTRRYPHVHVSIHVADQEDILNGLRMGHFELALTFNLGLSDQFKWTTLATLPPKIVLPARHRLAASRRISLRQIANEPLVLMDLPHTRDYFLSLFHSQRLVPKVGFRSSSFETVRTLVGNGLGYSLLNLEPQMRTTYDGTRVVYRPTKERLLPLEVGCLERNGFQQRRIGTAFIEFTARFFEQVSSARR
ncbi:MAG: LysR substrate-binding domain-containing protein [Hyphomicrobiales bacterium]